MERPLDRHAFQRATHMIPQGTVEGKALLSGDDLQLLFEGGTEVSSHFARHLRQRRALRQSGEPRVCDL